MEGRGKYGNSMKGNIWKYNRGNGKYNNDIILIYMIYE